MKKRSQESPTVRSAPFVLGIALVTLILTGRVWWAPLRDPDLWWLLHAGEQILAGGVPTTNGLSWLAMEEPWTLHEPLVAMVYAAVGVEAVGLVRGAVATALALLLVRLATREGAWPAIAGLLLASPLIAPYLSERAMLWGLTLLAAQVALQESQQRWRYPLGALLVGIHSLTHGSFVFSLAVLAIRSPRWAALAGIGVALTPGGAELWGLVLQYGSGAGFGGQVHSYIVEWGPLVPTTPTAALHLVCLTALVTLAWRRGPIVAPLLLVGFTLLAARHQRFVAVAAVVALPWACARLAELLPMRSARGALLTTLALALPLPILAPTAEVDQDVFPPGALELLTPEDRVYSDIEFGAWLGHHGAKIFWDSRNDCYPGSLYDDGVAIQQRPSEAPEILRRHGATRVLTANQHLQGSLRTSGWTEVERWGGTSLLAATSQEK